MLYQIKVVIWRVRPPGRVSVGARMIHDLGRDKLVSELKLPGL